MAKLFPCPTCGAQVDPYKAPAAPFCSERCRQVDLGRWLNEEHGLPVVREPEEDDESPENDGD